MPGLFAFWTMQRLTIDKQSFRVTSREFTDQGYLRVPGNVARTGVQQYLAQELGLNDRKPDEIVNVYRPPQEVFKPESLETYQNADVTDEHPGEMVDAESFKRYAVGHTLGAGRQDGDFVVVDMIIKDKAAIDAIRSGKAELSAGYTNDYEYEPGTAPDGTDYEYVQKNIRINHIALVDRARAGKQAKLFDDEPEGLIMSTVTIDGKSVKVGDESTAQLIQHTLDAEAEKMKELQAKKKEAEDMCKQLDEQMEKLKAENDSKDEELEKYKKESSDEAIAKRLQEVTETKDQAMKIAGKDFTCDSINPLEIKKAALMVSRPTIDWADKSEHYISAAWDMESTKSEDDRSQQSRDGFAGDMAGLYTNDGGAMKGDAAYAEFLNGGKA